MSNLVRRLFDCDLVKSSNQHGTNLYIHKYKKKVFYNNLWNEDDILLNARGTITTKDRVVVMPFTKVFNYRENGKRIDFNTKVTAIQKINGFMGAYTYDSEFGEIFSTTGSMTSDFVSLFQRKMREVPNIQQFFDQCKTIDQNTTFLFEVCDDSDPHIIDEIEGVYLIGISYMIDDTVVHVGENVLDISASKHGFNRPYVIRDIKFGDLVERTKHIKHEGYMVRRESGFDDILLKMKSPYYLIKKFLIRSNTNSIFSDKYKKLFDEEFYPIIEKIQSMYPIEYWDSLSENDRKSIVEDVVNEYYDSH